MEKILEKTTRVSRYRKSGVIKLQGKDLAPYIGKRVKAIIKEVEE